MTLKVVQQVFYRQNTDTDMLIFKGIKLKGQCNEMDISFEDLNILNNTFCICADSFQGLSKAKTLSLIFFIN